MRLELALALALCTLCGCASALDRCVRKWAPLADWGESTLVCDGPIHAQRTGEDCGGTHEEVELVNCKLRSWDGNLSGPVIVYMPDEPDVCDLRTQPGGLCFE